MTNFVLTLKDNSNLTFQGQIVFHQQTHSQERTEQERKVEERVEERVEETLLMMIAKIIYIYE